MGVVIAPPGNEHIEKIIGIDIVANPASSRDLKVNLRYRVEVDLPFLIGDSDIDTELGFPHLLNCYCDFAMGFLCVVKNFNARPSVSIGVPSLCQQPAGLAGVVVKELGREVTQGIRWRDGVSRYCGILQY